MTDRRAPTRRRWADRLLALLIVALTTTVLQLASRTEGYNRDEGYYFDAAERYWQWYAELGEALAKGHPLEALNQQSVDRWWSYNHEHPPLMKTLFAFSWRAFHRCHCPEQNGLHSVSYKEKHKTLEWLSESQAMRLPTQLLTGLMAAFIFLFGVRAFSRTAGLVAATLSVAAPRLFFHAQLSCFDAPVAATWVICLYFWWRSLDEARFAKWCGLAFGLALSTKHNGFFLPFVMLAHYLWIHRGTLRRSRLPPIPYAFVWMGILGPIIEIGLWPWMWFHTVERMREYFAFHLHHVYYNFEYLGVNYNKPPFPRSEPFVLTALTVPVTTLFLALFGGLHLLAQKRRTSDDSSQIRWTTPGRGLPNGAGFLFVLNVFFPPAIIALTGAPIFGATKHWLAAIPFMALLAGHGVEILAKNFAEAFADSPIFAQLVRALLVLAACAPAVADTWRSHPYGLTHYNLLAGGPPGGADLGLNRQFWGYSTRGTLPWLNEHAPKRARIYFHDTNTPIENMNVREGLMRHDFVDTGLEEPGVRASQIAMVIHEKHFNKYEYWIWDFYGTTQPALVLADEGVPIVTVYERPSPSKNALTQGAPSKDVESPKPAPLPHLAKP